jgi:hypothetical protein
LTQQILPGCSLWAIIALDLAGPARAPGTPDLPKERQTTMTTRRVHYVLSTHWDREWYQTFQDFRYRLVHLLDRVLEGWEEGELRGPFQTDGQAILLEDYLEVRPERRPAVQELARRGRLVVGPWYALPDEFLVSGESLIRNLALGRAVARSLGGVPSNAGFLCDIFGHNSQMPQIFAGFGIPAGFLWRGTNLATTRQFRWRGADGTEIPCYRFGHNGYCTFASDVRPARDPYADRSPQAIRRRLRAFLETEDAQTDAGPLLAFDGCDHLEWDRATYAEVVKEMRRRGGPFEVVHTSLDAYMQEMTPHAAELPTVLEGELREPGCCGTEADQQWLIPGVVSSRVWIKQANAACQALLCQWAEPFSALAHRVAGADYPQGLLDVAWRWLISNHAHDSICGCSIDAVHEDMKYRFAQAQQIGERLAREGTRALAAAVAGEPGPDASRVAIFNPLPAPYDGVVELALDIPTDWPSFHYSMGPFEPTPAFRIHGPGGDEIPYQRLGQSLNRSRFRIYSTCFPRAYKVHEVRVALPLAIPALGYVTVEVRRGEAGQPTRHPTRPGLAISERSMANEYLAVTVEGNGSLTLQDRRTGRCYERLLTLEDRADIGDGWNYGAAFNDQAFTSTGCRSTVALVSDGPFMARFRVRTVMELPAAFDFGTMQRAEGWQPLTVDSIVTLRAGAAHVEVETTVHNAVQDHRLRALFPSGAATDTYLADGPFDAIERPIALRADNYSYREMEVETKPQQTWTAVFDTTGGLAVVSAGLYESAVLDLPERPIALTLFRGTRRTVFTDGEPAGQLAGELHFRYWIAPLQGEPDRPALFRLGQLLEAGLCAAQLTAEDVALVREGTLGAPGARLPRQAGFLGISGLAVLTSLREPQDPPGSRDLKDQEAKGLEARLFNPTTTSGEVVLDFNGCLDGHDLAGFRRPVRCQPVDFEGNAVGPALPVENGRVAVTLAPKRIVTLRLS